MFFFKPNWAELEKQLPNSTTQVHKITESESQFSSPPKKYKKSQS